MITQEHEYYIRFILLLLQVGTDLLRELIEIALQRKGQALCQFLNSAEPALLNDKHLTQIQKDTLYPPNPQVASINDFDITILSHLLIYYLNGFIDNNERKGVNDIRHLRNNHHAHATECKMDIVTFTREWNRLATIISYAGNGLSQEVQQRHIDMTASIENDQLDITAVAEQIKKLDQSRVFFENIQTCLDDMNRVQEELVAAVEIVQIVAKKTEVEVENIKTIVQNTGVTVDALKNVAQNTDGRFASVQNDVLEMKAMLYKIKERTENQGRITKVVHTVYGKVYLSADEQEIVDHAEAALIEASNNSIAKKEPTDLSHQALQAKVTQVLEDIENLDVKVVAVEKGSVVFGFECYSIRAILELIDYFYSSSFQRRLVEITNALENIIGKKISITSAVIDRQSIQDVMTKMESKEYEKVVQFELSCTGVDGLLHALEAFEEGYAANSMNELSKAMSESIGKPVTLHTSIDVDQMRSAIQSIQYQLVYKSQDSHRKLIDPSMHPMNTFQNIQADQADLKQPSAKQDITELESEDEHMQRLQYSIQGDSHPNQPSSPSFSYLPRVKRDPEVEYCIPGYTQDISDRIDGGDTPVGCRLRKSVDDTLSERVVHMLCGRMRSVGLLIGNGRPCGTVFRVGSKFLMTALHCVNNIKDLENEVCVNFNSSLLLPQRKMYHLTSRTIYDEDLDFIILEISDPDEQLPEALELDKDITDVCSVMNSVSLIGYGHPDKVEKTLDPDCKLISANALRTLETEGEQWLKENESDYRTALKKNKNDPDLVNIGYRGINMPGKFYLHSSMQGDASGAPAITTLGSKHKVVGMLTHGLQLQHGIKTILMCAVASMMSSIYECVKACEPAVAADLFLCS